MKTLFKTLLLLTLLSIVSCDNNDDAQTTPSTPTDGFTIGTTFHATPNAYVAIDQLDSNSDGFPDYYSLFLTNGRMTDTFGDVGTGYGYAYSTNTTKLVQLKVLAAFNPSLTTGSITAGNTYYASPIITPLPTGFSADSFVAYDLQPGSIFGNENGFDFTQIPETIGIWHYSGTSSPQVIVNAINIDTTTPSNSTIDVDYTFMDTFGTNITGHYEGTLGIILD